MMELRLCKTILNSSLHPITEQASVPFPSPALRLQEGLRTINLRALVGDLVLMLAGHQGGIHLQVLSTRARPARLEHLQARQVTTALLLRVAIMQPPQNSHRNLQLMQHHRHSRRRHPHIHLPALHTLWVKVLRRLITAPQALTTALQAQAQAHHIHQPALHIHRPHRLTGPRPSHLHLQASALHHLSTVLPRRPSKTTPVSAQPHQCIRQHRHYHIPPRLHHTLLDRLRGTSALLALVVPNGHRLRKLFPTYS